MKINNVNKFPDKEYDYYDLSGFSKYDIKNIPKEVEEIWYWYGVGSYEGAGELIARLDNGLYMHHSCGHCSCFGPTEDICIPETRKTLKELVDSMSDELKENVKPILDAML